MEIMRLIERLGCRHRKKQILGLVALGWAATAAAQQAGPVVLASPAEQAALFEEVPLTGTVVSPRIAELSTEVSGIVDTIKVSIGDRLRVGDEILRLNSELESLTLAAARANTERAEWELEDAKRRLKDARALGKVQSLSASEVESLAAEVRIDGAELARSRAQEKREAARLQRHRLRAPFAGIISRKLVEQGEWIQPGQVVVELVSLDGLRIDFQAPQSVYPKLDKSSRLRIRLNAVPGETFDGVIEAIIPVTDPVSRTFLLRAAVTATAARMVPGMSASAVLRLDTGEQGVVVSRDALIRYPDGRTTVWVVNQDGEQAVVSEQPVRTGLSFNGKVAVTGGLMPNTLVVVQGNESLRDGQKVVVRQTARDSGTQ